MMASYASIIVLDDYSKVVVALESTLMYMSNRD